MAAFDWAAYEKEPPPEPESGRHWAVSLSGWLVRRLRPRLGWLIFIVTGLLVLDALLALEAARWVNLAQSRHAITWIALLAPLTAWLIHRLVSRLPAARPLAAGIYLLLGPLLIAQVLVGWLPSPEKLWRALGSAPPNPIWQDLVWQMGADLTRLGLRLALWVDGVRTGGATQDDLVFLALALAVVWIATGLTVDLLLATRQGLIAALPLLWLIGSIVYYSNDSRLLLVAAVALALLLHLRLDQQALFTDWEGRQVPFSPDLSLDRMIAAGTLALASLAVAALLPHVYVGPLARAVYQALDPWNSQLTAAGQRLFPDMQRDLYGRFAPGQLGDLPNSFLLGGGVELGDRVVMRVRTNESRMELMGSGAPRPLGHYVRGAILSRYDGRSWQFGPELIRQELAANRPWGQMEDDLRRPLLQSILVNGPASVIYAAPEAVEVSVATRADRQGQDLVILRPANPRSVSSYTVLSSLPQVDAAILAALPPVAPDPIWADYLALPESITPRTQALAAQLAQDATSPYGIAAAIESHLRTFPYDLEVAGPDPGAEVADYFLFDLGRGYCDFYATAFVVLARLNGLPARFATGYVMGAWDDQAREWTVTEAEAHSWPEVYFPQAGWVAFEPTAGRPALVRQAATVAAPLVTPLALPEFEPFQPQDMAWNWQMLFWLLPIGLLVFGIGSAIWRWRRGREDAWLGLLFWGGRLGRPAGPEETPLEYGQGLIAHLSAQPTRQPETLRTVGREILSLSQEASQIHYGPTSQRPPAQAAARRRWQILRGYLVRLWWGR